jgi:hypothetical protein
MNRHLSILLTLTSVVLGAVLVSACKPESRSQVLQPTVAPAVLPSSTATIANAASATIIPIANKVPVCQFKAGSSTSPVSPPSINDYTVSSFTPIFTNTTGMNIYGWLPDNEHLIISRWNDQENNATLDILDILTRQIRIYAERSGAGGSRPIWLPDLQALVYTDFDLPQKLSSLPGVELWLSRGNPNEKQRLAEHVSMNSLTVDDTGQLAYLFSQKNTEAVDLSVKTVNAASLSVRDVPLPAVLSKSSALTDESLPEVEMPWTFLHRPTTSQAILLYKNQPPVLFDFSSGQICQVEVPLYVGEAMWSPDGRFLALRTRNMPAGFTSSATLTILDTNTNQYDDVDLGGNVYGMIWSPTGRHLAVLAQKQDVSASVVHQNLYLVDAINQEYQSIIPDYDFQGGADQNYQMAWSFDGKMLAITCPIVPRESPVITEFRLCIAQLTQSQ